jgi:alkylated DNA repair dioxygenase AlkB
MDHLVRSTAWSQPRREMYDRTVDVPRLVAALPDAGPGHPVLDEVRRALERRYGVTFPHVSLGYYRDGRDSVAWHGDYVAREMDEALVATVSLGEPRRFLLRPKGGGRSLSFQLGWGDLLVMGGTSQRTWEHAVPKVALARPRLAVMFRPTWYREAG